MSAAVQYARPVEVTQWDEERNPSAYVVPFDQKRTIEIQDSKKSPYMCKFFLFNETNKEKDLEKKDSDVSYFRVKKADSKLLKSEHVDVQRESAQDEIRALANYMDDWDGYGAIRPLSECLNHALEIVRNKKINLDFLTDIYPNPNGTLSLEWEQDDNEIGLELGKEEFSFFAHFGELHSYNNKKRYAAEEIERLAEFVSYLR